MTRAVLAKGVRQRRFLRMMTVIAGIAVVVGAALLLRERSDLLGERSNGPEVYGAAFSGVLYSPFGLEHEPMERLMLVNFTQDPDEIYEGFEPQVFDDPRNGRGFRVIAWRRDGRVDVYDQPGLRLDRAAFGMVGKGLAEAHTRPFENARFTVSPTGVDAHFAFEDATGREVEVTVRESGSKQTAPFGLLAPMGEAATNPPTLPLVILHDFYFVRRANSELSITIAGKEHQPDALPLPIDGSRMYFTRYAADPFIVRWSPQHDGELAPLAVEGEAQGRAGEVLYDLVWNDGHPEIQAMRVANERHAVQVAFSPPVPDITSLRDGVRTGGTFVISCGEGVGTVSGRYDLARSGNDVTMGMTPSDGWKPSENKLMVRFLYAVQPLFRNWPKTYEWQARVVLEEGAAPRMTSSWRRTHDARATTGEDGRRR